MADPLNRDFVWLSNFQLARVLRTTWARRKAMKFAPARTLERFKRRKRPGAQFFHENFDFPKISATMTRSLASTSSGATNSFCDLAPPNESHMRENYKKNTVGPNEFTDFEKFPVEHPDRIKTILATNWRNHPGDGITLRHNRSTSHVKWKLARRKAMKFAPAMTPGRLKARKRPRSCIFHGNFDFPKLWVTMA